MVRSEEAFGRDDGIVVTLIDETEDKVRVVVEVDKARIVQLTLPALLAKLGARPAEKKERAPRTPKETKEELAARATPPIPGIGPEGKATVALDGRPLAAGLEPPAPAPRAIVTRPGETLAQAKAASRGEPVVK